MAAKKKSKFENKFKSTAASDSRTANVRDEHKVKDAFYEETYINRNRPT